MQWGDATKEIQGKMFFSKDYTEFFVRTLFSGWKEGRKESQFRQVELSAFRFPFRVVAVIKERETLFSLFLFFSSSSNTTFLSFFSSFQVGRKKTKSNEEGERKKKKKKKRNR